MKWEIVYYNNQVQEKVLSFPAKILARYLKLTDLMEEYGSNLGMPHTEALGKGLFELRIKASEGIGRVFYCTLKGKKIYMLHCFIKKTQKTPKQELEIARERLKELNKND